MEILSWEMAPELKKELDDHYQSTLVETFKHRDPMEIIRAYTFSYGGKNLSLREISDFLAYVNRLLGTPLTGTGIELGAGPGTHAALIAKQPQVDRVYALEASERMVRELMPVVVPFILTKDASKVVGVVGDFSAINLPDASLDFAFDFFSLHHSPDLPQTLSEIYRVLKPGGFLLCFDKARDDSMTESDLNALMDSEYSPEFKKTMGIPVTQSHTRRMNGEHEHRLKDWQRYFADAGFSRAVDFNVARTTSGNLLVSMLKRFFAYIPPRIQATITNLLPIRPTNNISRNNRIYTPLIQNYQKEISLLVAYK